MTIKLHDLRPAPGSKTARTRVGRGEASKGKTAGRGTKGSKARGQVPARLEGGQTPLHMRLPKLKGSSPSDHQTARPAACAGVEDSPYPRRSRRGLQG